MYRTGSGHARTDYWLFYAATFLCFFTVAQTALLAIIFKEAQMAEKSIGFVLGARNVTAILGTLFSGVLMQRLGALRTALVGLSTILLSFIGLQFTYDAVAPALAMRLAAGAGFGIYIPAGFVYMKTKSGSENQAYHATILVTAMTIPNIFGPTLAESYLRVFGVHNFFIIMGIPPVGRYNRHCGIPTRHTDVSSNNGRILSAPAQGSLSNSAAQC